MIKKMDSRGEISILVLIKVFVLLIMTVFLVRAGMPMINALFFNDPAFASGTFARFLLDLFPLSGILACFYLLFRQGPPQNGGGF